jgi:alpha-1,3-mannosyltransferase
MVKRPRRHSQPNDATASTSIPPTPAVPPIIFPPLTTDSSSPSSSSSTPPRHNGPRSTIPLLESQIVLVPRFLSPETCASYVACFSTLPLLRSAPPGRGEATRTNSRLAVEDVEFARRLFGETGLEEVTKGWEIRLGKRVLRVRGLHSRIRIYKYEEGTFFGRHYDESTWDAGSGFVSYWTLLVYLTGKEDGVEGGETAFYLPGTKKNGEKEIVVAIERGLALLHRHGGSDCLLQEGRVVTKGTKWVLRSDLVFG